MVVNFDNFRYNFIKKIPVMSDNNDGSLIIHQKRFKPGGGIHVQMVGRLIEKKNIRFCEEKASQGNSGLLTAGEKMNFFIKIFLGKAKTFKNTDDLASVSIAVLIFKGLAHPGITFQKLV